ncbi:MAG TPA: T9SS type A sorting domain-containing protein, partial [Candidatus Cloacimonetes bacterium]|nr:T9SS type A sorting domain-containing protein [Candidatus Cloacimonadota bacterium]
LQIWTDDWENEHRTEFVYENVRIEDNEIYAENISLSNFPNPFHTTTTISFSCHRNTEFTEILFYNIKGQKIDEIEISDQQTEINWNAERFPSGTYFYRMKTRNKFSQTKKMVLMR